MAIENTRLTISLNFDKDEYMVFSGMELQRPIVLSNLMLFYQKSVWNNKSLPYEKLDKRLLPLVRLPITLLAFCIPISNMKLLKSIPKETPWNPL